MSARDLLRANDARFHALAAGSPPTSGHSQACAMAGPTTTCWRTSSSGTAREPPRWRREMLRHGGSFDRANAAMARSLAATADPRRTARRLRAADRRPRGLGRYFPPRLLLGDHITHELDMLFALDREPAIPAEALVAVLNTQVSVPNPFVPAFRNSRGLRLVGHRRRLDTR